MRPTLFLMFLAGLLGFFIWLSLSGFFLFLAMGLLTALMVITLGYADTAILLFLGAREVRSGDEPLFYEAAAQEAYKLSLPVPKLYLYNGTFERAFVLQHQNQISLVMSRSLLREIQGGELSVICFELLLQVKKGLAAKRTKAMYTLGFMSWIIHFWASLICRLLPGKDARNALNWAVNYLLHPWLDFLFVLLLGEVYFRKLQLCLKEYPVEMEAVEKLGLRLRRPAEIYSLTSRKMLELSSSSRSRHFQNIIALELLPHEWDYFFKPQEVRSVK